HAIRTSRRKFSGDTRGSNKYRRTGANLMDNFSLVGNYGEVKDGKLYGPGDPRNHESMQGMYGATGRYANGPRKRRVMEAARLYADVISGKVPSLFLQEAMTPRYESIVTELMRSYPGMYRDERGRTMGLRETMSVTDYQALFVDVLDRMYYGYYSGFPVVNKGLAKIHQLRDFRVVSRYLLDGVVTPLTAMDAAAPAPQRALLGPNPQDGSPATSTAPIQYQPKLYQAMTSVNWRAFVNDDLGIFKDLANRLAIAGNRGISKFITTMYVGASGPNTSLYQSGYRNQITVANGASINNPPMGSQGIMDAIKILTGMRDSGGDPILITGKLRLWFGPALAAVAQNILNAVKVQVSVEGGSANAQGFPSQFL